MAHPDQIGPYRILQVLGQGWMGVVYEAGTPKRRACTVGRRRSGITRGYVEMLRALDRNRDAAAPEAKVR